ncbi:hypothetical protein Hjap01_04054 [Haloarcula japonica]
MAGDEWRASSVSIMAQDRYHTSALIPFIFVKTYQ